MTPKQEQILRRPPDATKIVIDTETSGLSWQKNHVVGWVITLGPRDDDTGYFPIRHRDGGNCVEAFVPQTAEEWDDSVTSLEKDIVRTIDRQGVEIIGQNLSFDLKFASRVGFNKFDAKFGDTMVNGCLINEWEKSFSLDNLCRVNGVAQKKTSLYEYIAAKIPEAQGQTKNAMGHFWKLRGDDPQAVEYAEGDGISTWALWHKQLEQIELQNLQLVHSIECKLIPVLCRMMIRGIAIDEERLHWVKGEIARRRDEALKMLPEGFNSRAPSQVRKLMEEAGHTDWPMTAPSKTFPNGVPSFNEMWMLTNPVGKRIIDVRKLENLDNSFITPMTETHLWRGSCHPDYNQLRGDEFGTITGRLSSSNPNLQQVSKRNKDLGRLHRSIFIPGAGMIWGSADYKQMEPSLLAYYSRCKVLMDGFWADPPVDPHQAVANATGMDRETGKRINQTLITGGGKKVLVSKYGIAADQVDKVWDDYFEKLPEIKSFQKQASNRMRQRGYVLSLLGRRCRLNDPRKDYVALNRLLQGGNADCIKIKMCEVDAYLRSEGDRVHMLNNVHDSLDFEFEPQDEPIYKEALRIMTSFGEDDTIKLDVPIKVDHMEGASWSEATWGKQ